MKHLQWTFALLNADAEIYCHVLGSMQEYQTFWYSYFSPCFKYESGLKKTNMHMVKVGNILLPTCKNYAKH